jgi:uncharacterized protein
MIFKVKTKDQACEVHGNPQNAANKTLIGMMVASFLIIAWHVWVFGPTGQTAAPEIRKSFPVLFAGEIWDLIFSPHGILAELRDVLPYFLAGILLAGYIRTYKLAVKLRMYLGRYGFMSIFLASLIGILTPLCACGTLTTAVSLLFAGLPLAPVMALLVTSPLLSPSTYLLTLNDLGPEWTVIRTVAAFSMGISAGVVTHLLRNRGFNTETIFIEGAVPRGDFHDEDYPDKRLRCNCKEKFGNRVAATTNNMFVVFLAKSSEMVWLVGKYVILGVAIGSIAERYMPREWIYSIFGQKNALSIVWVTFGSVPVFLHQISASSIVYHIKAALDGTLDGGASLAFMIGGPVTAIPVMVMFWTMFKKRVFFLYMFVCVAGTIAISFAFQAFVFVPDVDTGNSLLRDVRSMSGGSASVINKQNRHVRIVMDPAGKAMVATYQNDPEGEGGVVFDSGFSRILNGQAELFDNRKYIRNVAEWLLDNSSSPERNILVYNTFHKSGLDNNSFSKDVWTSLEQEGFKIRLTDRNETPRISGNLLEEYNQLWIIFGEAGSERYIYDDELNTIAGFSGSGRSMLLVSGNQDGGNDQSAANQISSRYGVVFSGSADNREEIRTSTASHFLHRAAAVLGRILKLVNKA